MIELRKKNGKSECDGQPSFLDAHFMKMTRELMEASVENEEEQQRIKRA